MHEKFILQQKIKYKSLNYSSLKKYKVVLAELDALTNQFHWMFDYYKNCFYYITENTGLFPNRENAFIPGKGYQCLIDNTHPDDVNYLLEIQKQAFRFFFSQKIEDRLNYKFAFKMRILTKSGEFLPFLFMIKATALDKDNHLWISLANGTASQTEKLFHPIIISTTNQNMSLIPEVNHFKIEYALPAISSRELEVIRLMGKNKSAEEITRMLNITLSTLKHHKNNLFKKLNATNSIVAIENARLLGILIE